jgi:hypothetical protein
VRLLYAGWSSRGSSFLPVQEVMMIRIKKKKNDLRMTKAKKIRGQDR